MWGAETRQRSDQGKSSLRAAPASAWYYHRFYDFEPDLNVGNDAVQAEIESLMGCWLALGVAGFRMDATPFIIELTEPDNPNSPHDFDQLTRYRERLSWRRCDAVILAEANVTNDELPKYFRSDGATNGRLPMLFDFLLSVRTLLALARETPIFPFEKLCRDHDEVDLSRQSKQERGECFPRTVPTPTCRFTAGASAAGWLPMPAGEQSRLCLAYSLQLTLPGIPVLRYGEELGMGDDLSLPEREALRTPMQWSNTANGGFSTSAHLVRPVITDGPYGYAQLNVVAARLDSGSLLQWFENMIRTLRECPEVGVGTCSVIEAGRDPATKPLTERLLRTYFTVRARMPRVARSAASGMTGKMPASRYGSAI